MIRRLILPSLIVAGIATGVAALVTGSPFLLGTAVGFGVAVIFSLLIGGSR